MIKVAIAGSTGYIGVELLRILHNHPSVSVVYVGTESYVDQSFASVYPHLQQLVHMKGNSHDALQMAGLADVVFTAMPHGVAMEMAPTILKAGKRLIDLGADFRLKNPDIYQRWYQHVPAAQDLLDAAVYGLPEVGGRTKVPNAQLIANPGCYPTSCALAAMPAIKAGIIDLENIIFDSKSGTSGAGRGLSLGAHVSEVTENFKAYNIAGAHRHTPEIEQTLTELSHVPIQVQFTPHLVPMVRGILTTAYFRLTQSLTAQQVWEIYHAAYDNEPFVRLRPLGHLPETKHVKGANFCDIGLQVDPRTGRLIVISVIDNLVKGAAGQAIQNMNLMFGLPETLGLTQLVPLYP